MQDPPSRTHGASTVDLSGRCVGSSYILVRPIGQGATGTVWRGVDRSSGEQVAVKLLHESLLRQPKLVTRFVQERTILLMLRHRNVVRVRDLFSVGESLGLVMDLVPGGSLREHLREHHTVPPGQAARMAAQVAAALAEAHDLGVIHRDLKPDNILLEGTDGRPDIRLTDFGIARVLNTPSLTTSHAVVGTPHYMAPEAFHGAPAGPAADVYALGVLLYELVVGCPPYDSDSVADLMRRHLDEEPERRPGIPDDLWAVIVACMEKKPRLRPTATELVADLTAVARETAHVPALRPRPRPEAAPPAATPESPEPPGDVEAPQHPSLSGGVRLVPRRRNQVPAWRWARPGAMVALVCGAMLVSGVATSAWHLSRAAGTDIRAVAPLSPASAPAPASPAPSPASAPASWSQPSARPSPPHSAAGTTTATRAGGEVAGSAVRGVRDGVSEAAQEVATATVRPVARAAGRAGRTYGPLQCRQQFQYSDRTPVLAETCHAVGGGIRVLGRLAAPAGGRASATVALVDTANGRTVSGRTCERLAFAEHRTTQECGFTAERAPHGHRYAVVLSWRYTRQGGTVRGDARGAEFGW